MRGNGHCGRGSVLPLLHHDVAAPSSDLTKPCLESSRQTPAPDQARNLANRRRYFHLRHIHFAAESFLDFLLFRHLEEQRQGFDQILAGFGHGLALARNVKLHVYGLSFLRLSVSLCQPSYL